MRRREMKRFILCVLTLMLALSFTAYAENGKVTYSGNSGGFIFAPGSEYSPTDLFPNFKDVMPGDTVAQTITVKNNADEKVKVEIYLRALGAHEDSVEFLSKLGLKVQKSESNEMAYMFDAAANETAQLTDWVCLGTLYSGGEVNLDVLLEVPTELSNEFQSAVGYLDWEFMVKQFPIDPSDPRPPQTGDDGRTYIYIAIMLCSLAVIIFLIVRSRKNKKED